MPQTYFHWKAQQYQSRLTWRDWWWMAAIACAVVVFLALN